MASTQPLLLLPIVTRRHSGTVAVVSRLGTHMTQLTRNPVALATTLLDGADPAPLFTPFTFAGLEFANRFVMAP